MIEVGNIKYLFSDRAKTIHKAKAFKTTDTPSGKVYSFNLFCPVSNEFIVSFEVTEVTEVTEPKRRGRPKQ